MRVVTRKTNHLIGELAQPLGRRVGLEIEVSHVANNSMMPV